MEEPDHMAIIEDLKQKLTNTLINNNFNLQHPHVLHLSCKIDTLLIPFFRNQLPKAKVIKFPIKQLNN